MPEFFIRLLEAAGLILAGWLIFRFASSVVLARAGRASVKSQNEPGERLFEPGRPAILYFTTPQCVTCKTFQRPQLRRLADMLGDRVQVVEIDAGERPGLAGSWGVLSVPTTFVIGPDGAPRHVNHGAITAEKLAQQIQSISK